MNISTKAKTALAVTSLAFLTLAAGMVQAQDRGWSGRDGRKCINSPGIQIPGTTCNHETRDYGNEFEPTTEPVSDIEDSKLLHKVRCTKADRVLGACRKRRKALSQERFELSYNCTQQCYWVGSQRFCNTNCF